MKIRFMYAVSRDGVQLHDQEAILEVATVLVSMVPRPRASC
jgi:hypothetical protein